MYEGRTRLSILYMNPLHMELSLTWRLSLSFYHTILPCRGLRYADDALDHLPAPRVLSCRFMQLWLSDAVVLPIASPESTSVKTNYVVLLQISHLMSPACP
jgi:hypothetical protein